MSEEHRAEQIVQRAVSIIAARVNPKGAKVFAHRRNSLAPDQDELPAHSVDYGSDEALEPKFLGVIDSLLTLQTTAVVSGATEEIVREALLDMRRDQHIALMADPRLGFGAQGFVVTTRYGGAEAPELGTEGEELFGRLTSLWLVHYRMEPTDPGN